MTLVNATTQATPGGLTLSPNTTEAYTFYGLAYMDADISCSLAAPKLTGNFRAAGPWQMP